MIGSERDVVGGGGVEVLRCDVQDKWRDNRWLIVGARLSTSRDCERPILWFREP